MSGMWIFYTLLTAFFLASSDAITKDLLTSYSPWQVIRARFILALVFLAPLPFIYGFPSLDATFWIAAGTDLPLEVLALLLYLRAIEVSPLSLSLPFLSFTPLFLLVTSRIMMGEQVSLQALIGILSMVAGSYLLQVGKVREGLMAPVRALAREKGSMLMLLVAFIYSITSNLGKVAITHSSPQFFATFFSLEMALVALVVPWGKGQQRTMGLKDKAMVLMALFFALHYLFHTLALDLARVSYMIPLKRTSILFGVIYGRILYKEEDIKERLLGASLMVAGALLISLAP
jgi:uncharacterized membrane protein